ncbi:MAG TPA: hypothetical protein VFL91_14375 [Thermomicrobiales bacterium]|nr:hypothetical protein [Thermomicrobiales bacterium]
MDLQIAHLVFGGSCVVLGLVLVWSFARAYGGYARKWAEVAPTSLRRGQVMRASFGGLLTALLMIGLGAAIAAGGSLGPLGWLALLDAVAGYALLYPLSDERRFIGGPRRDR